MSLQSDRLNNVTQTQWATHTILIPELDFNDTETHDQLTSSQQSMDGNALHETNILSHKDLAQTSGPETAGETLCSQTDAERRTPEQCAALC